MADNLRNVQLMSLKPTDISDHLETIYRAVVEQQPKPRLIIELGVGTGQSSKVFGYVNREIGSTSIGVDILELKPPVEYDCFNGYYMQMDDITLGKHLGFITKNKIDVLMIDSSHLYDHTVQELKTYDPLLSDECMLILHDTNLAETFHRRDGSVGRGWNNQRGVVRALQEYLQYAFDEDVAHDAEFDVGCWHWRIHHDPVCNGLTICWRSPVLSLAKRLEHLSSALLRTF